MGELCSALEQEKSSTPRGFSWYTNMAAVSLFWNTNMVAVTSCGNALYVLNSRSHTNDRHLRVTRCFIPLSSFEFLSLSFSLNFQLINFPLHERIHLYFSCPRPYNVSNGPRPRFIPNSYVAIYYHFSHSLKHA